MPKLYLSLSELSELYCYVNKYKNGRGVFK